MAWFPIMIELEGRPCLVAGGGAAALRKGIGPAGCRGRCDDDLSKVRR